jgi:hypothetical protein
MAVGGSVVMDHDSINDENSWAVTERDVRAALDSVRLVFETGFPDDLVERALRVVSESAEKRRLVKPNMTVSYPGCWLLTAASLALDYDGTKLWQRPEFKIFGTDLTEIGPITRAVIESCGLETFEEYIRAENGLINVTPLLMHAGIPVASIPTLVGLIDSALRRHAYSAEDQIELWSQTPNGFRGLWKGPERLLRLGGSIASDLLDQINEAIVADNYLETNLPRHLVEAIEQIDRKAKERLASRGRRLIPKPFVALDPWSGDGPLIWIPGVSRSVVEQWKISGVQSVTVGSLGDDSPVSIEPQRAVVVSALRESTVVQDTSIALYDKIPALVFDSANSRFLPRVGGSISVRGDSVWVLAPRLVTVESAGSTDDEFPVLVGRWSEWRVSRVTCERGETITLSMKGTNGVIQEKLRVVSAPRAPELRTACEVSGVGLRAGGVRVFSEIPSLELHVPDRMLSQMSVLVHHGDDEIEIEISSLEQLNQDLAIAAPVFSRFSLGVSGPIGTRMPKTDLIVIPELEVTQAPSRALLTEMVEVQLRCRDTEVRSGALMGARSAAFSVGSTEIEVDIVRMSWVLTGVEVTHSTGTNDVISLSLEDLDPERAGVIRLDTGSPVPVEFRLLADGSQLQSHATEGQSRFAAVDIARFGDTVRSSGAERIVLVAIVDERQFEIAEIISSYKVEIDYAEVVPGISPAVVDIHITHERPFDRRYIRIWELERPWLSSSRHSIADGAGETFSVPLPSHHRSGTYRLWLRVEEPWAASPRMPRVDFPGVIDVDVIAGHSRDFGDPFDRLLVAVNDPTPGFLEPDDVAQYGAILFSLLAFYLREFGPAGLTGLKASRIIHALDRSPGSIVDNLLKALDESLIEPADGETLSLAVLPSVLKHERSLDLELSLETRERVWAQLPLLAAAIESWTDGIDAQARWSAALGWPEMLEVQDEFESQLFDTSRSIEPIGNFAGTVRLAASSSELRDVLLADWPIGLSPLSVSGRAEAVLDLIVRWADDPRNSERWFETWSNLVRTASIEIDRTQLSGAVAEYAVAGMDEQAISRQWLLAEIAVISYYLTSQRDPDPELALALLTAIEIAPKWVTHSVLRGLCEYARLNYQTRESQGD